MRSLRPLNQNRFRTRGAEVLQAVDAQFTQVAQDVGRPTVNIVFHDLAAHSFHTQPSFRGPHFQGAMYGIPYAIDVVGIDDPRIAPFLNRKNRWRWWRKRAVRDLRRLFGQA